LAYHKIISYHVLRERSASGSKILVRFPKFQSWIDKPKTAAIFWMISYSSVDKCIE
jgi:hypothetical protein